jgi:hypothetical protein
MYDEFHCFKYNLDGLVSKIGYKMLFVLRKFQVNTFYVRLTALFVYKHLLFADKPRCVLSIVLLDCGVLPLPDELIAPERALCGLHLLATSVSAGLHRHHQT